MRGFDLISILLIIFALGLDALSLAHLGVFDPLYPYFLFSMSFILHNGPIFVSLTVLAGVIVFKFFVRLGIIKPIFISGLVARELSEWKKEKRYFASSFLTSITFAWMIIALMAILSYLVSLFDFYFISIFDLSSTHLVFQKISKDHISEFDDVLSSAAGAEATLVGIVIPVIFALVEQFFRDQNTVFKAFLFWSKVIWLTLSSLALVCFIFIQIAVPLDKTYLTFSLSMIWLICNVLGTAYLVIISVNFFFSEMRFALIKTYIGQVLLPKEVERNMTKIMRQGG